MLFFQLHGSFDGMVHNVRSVQQIGYHGAGAVMHPPIQKVDNGDFVVLRKFRTQSSISLPSSYPTFMQTPLKDKLGRVYGM